MQKNNKATNGYSIMGLLYPNGRRNGFTLANGPHKQLLLLRTQTNASKYMVVAGMELYP